MPLKAHYYYSSGPTVPRFNPAFDRYHLFPWQGVPQRGELEYLGNDQLGRFVVPNVDHGQRGPTGRRGAIW